MSALPRASREWMHEYPQMVRAHTAISVMGERNLADDIVNRGELQYQRNGGLAGTPIATTRALQAVARIYGREIG